MDESDHLTLVNAGDEEVVRQEEGEREGALASLFKYLADCNSLIQC